ncbi:MAG: twin-arginine translocation signal domain-containing protein, partial [Chitinophagales bacterium]
MEDNSLKQPRRDFLGKIAAGAAAMGIATIATPIHAAAETFRMDGTTNPDDADAWFGKIDGGKHKIMFDVTRP